MANHQNNQKDFDIFEELLDNQDNSQNQPINLVQPSINIPIDQRVVNRQPNHQPAAHRWPIENQIACRWPMNSAAVVWLKTLG